MPALAAVAQLVGGGAVADLHRLGPVAHQLEPDGGGDAGHAPGVLGEPVVLRIGPRVATPPAAGQGAPRTEGLDLGRSAPSGHDSPGMGYGNLALTPLSTTSVWPVTYDDRSDAK